MSIEGFDENNETLGRLGGIALHEIDLAAEQGPITKDEGFVDSIASALYSKGLEEGAIDAGGIAEGKNFYGNISDEEKQKYRAIVTWAIDRFLAAGGKK